MTADFVYQQVFSGALKKGASQTQARNFAVIASEKYRKGQYSKKALDLITENISLAVKQSINKSKRK